MVEVMGEPWDAMRSGIEMTITLPGHPMSVTQHYFNLEHLYNFWLLCTHLHRFQVIECDVYVSTPIVNDCLCADILVSSAVLRMSLLFPILKWKAPIPRKKPGRTHTHTRFTKKHRLSTLQPNPGTNSEFSYKWKHYSPYKISQ